MPALVHFIDGYFFLDILRIAAYSIYFFFTLVSFFCFWCEFVSRFLIAEWSTLNFTGFAFCGKIMGDLKTDKKYLMFEMLNILILWSILLSKENRSLNHAEIDKMEIGLQIRRTISFRFEKWNCEIECYISSNFKNIFRPKKILSLKILL